jgi:hypothetical protein
MAYSDPIAAKLYQRRYLSRPEVKERRKLAARIKRASGQREHKPLPAPIQRLQSAISAWRVQ